MLRSVALSPILIFWLGCSSEHPPSSSSRGTTQPGSVGKSLQEEPESATVLESTKGQASTLDSDERNPQTTEGSQAVVSLAQATPQAPERDNNIPATIVVEPVRSSIPDSVGGVSVAEVPNAVPIVFEASVVIERSDVHEAPKVEIILTENTPGKEVEKEERVPAVETAVKAEVAIAYEVETARNNSLDSAESDDLTDKKMAAEKAEKIEAEKMRAEKIEAEKAEAEKIAEAKFQAEKAETEKIVEMKSQAEMAEAEKVDVEKVAQLKFQTDKAEADKAEAEKIAEVKFQPEKIEVEKAEAEKIAEVKLQAEKMRAEKIASAKVEQEKSPEAEAEKIEAEKRSEILLKFVHEIKACDSLKDVRVLSMIQLKDRDGDGTIDRISYKESAEGELKEASLARIISRVCAAEIKNRENEKELQKAYVVMISKK